MAEFSDSITKNQSSSSYGLLCHFFFFHFCFFILLSPHVLSFISFLSPLFITTTLLSLLSLSSNSEFSDSKLGFLLSIFQRVSPKDDIFEESGFLEELQAYLDVFQAPPVSEVSEPESFKAPEEADHQMGPLKKDPNVTFYDENPIGKPDDDDDDDGDEQDKEAERQVAEEKSTESLLQHENNTGMEKEPDVNLHENPDGKHDNDDGDDDGDGGCYEHENEAGRPNAEEKSAESLLLHENTTKLEDMFCQKEDREVQESNKAEESKEKSAFTSGSKVMGNSDDNNNNSSKIDATSNSDGEYFGTPERDTIWEEKKPLSSFLGKEKEWRRTLACKLYEERHSHYYMCESEKMDLLWEAYDDDDDDTEANSNTNSKVQEKCKGNDGDEEEEEEEGMEGKYCCLKALKLSAGKMKLGMRRSNMVKISKVLKGIGLLQHVSKHGKKRV